MADEDSGRAALAAIDAALAREPQKDDRLLSQAMRNLTALRDGLSRTVRAADAPAGSRKRLELVNGVIATVFACHFPLGKVPWDELRETRDKLEASFGEAQSGV